MRKLLFKSLVSMCFVLSMIFAGGVVIGNNNNTSNTVYAETEQVGYLQYRAFDFLKDYHSSNVAVKTITFTNVNPATLSSSFNNAIIFNVGATDQTGNTKWTSESNCSKVEVYLTSTYRELAVYCPDTIYAPIDSSYLFSVFVNVTEINFDNFNTTNVTNMSYMFSSCDDLTSLDFTDYSNTKNLTFDTSAVTNMSYMFKGCLDLQSIAGEEYFDLTKVTDVSGMFYDCQSITTVNLKKNFSQNVAEKLTNTSYMYYNCKKLTSFVDLKNDDKVTNTSYMYYNCESLTGSLDITCYQSTDLSYMFAGCKGLTSIKVTNYSNYATNMSYMFADCSSLTSLNLSGLKTNNVTNMSHMFSSCINLTSLDLSNFDTSNVTNMSWMFADCRDLTTLTMNSTKFNTSNVTDMSYMFSSCESLTNLNISFFNTSNVTDMSAMFQSCKGLTTLNLSNFDTSKVTNMEYMFSNSTGLTNLNVSNFNTSKVSNMNLMFNNCRDLTSLNVSNFDTSNVTTMAQMFARCLSLISLDLSSFDTSKVTDMSWMFNMDDDVTYKDSELKWLNLGSFDTSKVTKMKAMFYKCTNLISLGSSTILNMSSIEDIDSMFRYCESLSQVNFFSDNERTLESSLYSSLGYINELNVEKLDLSWLALNLDTLDTYRFKQNLKEIKTPKILNSGSISFYGWNNYFTENRTLVTRLDSSNTSTHSTIKLGYTVTIDNNGGEAEEGNHWISENSNISKIMFYDETISAFPEIQKLGYELDGIYTAQENGQEVTTDYVPTQDVTLYAIWDTINYTITYNLNGGEATNPTNYTIESEDITLSNPLDRTGYTFLGWTSESIAVPTNNVVIEQGSIGNKTYTANWEVITYTITYNLDGGETTNPTTYNIENEDIALSNPTKKGYKFLGWTSEGENITEPTKNIVIEQGSTGNKTYTAVWKKDNTILYIAIGGGALITLIAGFGLIKLIKSRKESKRLKEIEKKIKERELQNQTNPNNKPIPPRPPVPPRQ